MNVETFRDFAVSDQMKRMSSLCLLCSKVSFNYSGNISLI